MNETYKLDYQNYYLQPDSWYGKCEECGCSGYVRMEAACGDYHSASICCFKDICYDGCTRRCQNCRKMNKVYYNDGYGEGFTCCYCKEDTSLDIKWWGNTLMENCRRYCGCVLQGWDGMIEGEEIDPTKSVYGTYDMFNTELKDRVISEINSKVDIFRKKDMTIEITIYS
jgi:hypothetical protein